VGKLLKLTARSVETSAPGELRDTEVRGLRLRTSPKGLRTFVLVARYPGQRHASRRALMATGLKEARIEAAEWKHLLRRGVDPIQLRIGANEAKGADDTFAAVAEAYISDIQRRKQRRAAVAAREIRKELIAVWDKRPVGQITRQDVVDLIRAIRDRPAPYYARNVLAHLRAIYDWAIDNGSYGLEASPCDRIKPRLLIGARQPRQRVLTDDEVRMLWAATGQLGYPLGPMYRLLLLTGQRKNEVAQAQWPELDLTAKLWAIPPERFKSGSPHIVPLTDATIALLSELPRFNGGQYLFSYSGRAPVAGHSVGKARLDALMQAQATYPIRFRTHDLRRTVRTGLSALRVPDVVAEMVIGHGRKGLQRIYDQHRFVEEMREALTAWNARLRLVVGGAT
jgi:integrase